MFAPRFRRMSAARGSSQWAKTGACVYRESRASRRYEMLIFTVVLARTRPSASMSAYVKLSWVARPPRCVSGSRVGAYSTVRLTFVNRLGAPSAMNWGTWPFSIPVVRFPATNHSSAYAFQAGVSFRGSHSAARSPRCGPSTMMAFRSTGPQVPLKYRNSGRTTTPVAFSFCSGATASRFWQTE